MIITIRVAYYPLLPSLPQQPAPQGRRKLLARGPRGHVGLLNQFQYIENSKPWQNLYKCGMYKKVPFLDDVMVNVRSSKYGTKLLATNLFYIVNFEFS